MQAESINLWNNVVAAHLKCETKNAKYLAIFDLKEKIENNDKKYDIGGTYSNGSDFWFLFNTRKFMKGRYLVNLFVCNRRAGSFTITTGEHSHDFGYSSVDNENADKMLIIELGNKTEASSFLNLPADSFSFLKTIMITENELDYLSNKLLFIELRIENDDQAGSKGIRDFVKESHDFGNILNDKEHSDITLESIDGYKFNAHKVVLAAHSPVLRKMLTNSSSYLKLPETKSDIEILLDFLYTGKVEDIEKKNNFHMLNLAVKYDLDGLKLAHNYEITEETALNILILAHKNNLTDLSNKVYDFIRDHPKVYELESWTNFKDVELMKKLFKNIIRGK